MPGRCARSILGVVARHADAATWDRLHAAAKAEKTPLVKEELYFLLAATEDEALARRALDLALTAGAGRDQQRGHDRARGRGASGPGLRLRARAHGGGERRRWTPRSRSRYLRGPGAASPRIRRWSGSSRPTPTRISTAGRAATRRRRSPTSSDRIRVRERVPPALDAWLARPPAGGDALTATGHWISISIRVQQDRLVPDDVVLVRARVERILLDPALQYSVAPPFPLTMVWRRHISVEGTPREARSDGQAAGRTEPRYADLQVVGAVVLELPPDGVAARGFEPSTFSTSLEMSIPHFERLDDDLDYVRYRSPFLRLAVTSAEESNRSRGQDQ